MTSQIESTRAVTRVSAVDVSLFILRVAIGVVFIAHGGQKLFGWWGGAGLAGTVSFMAQGGIPAPLAYIAVFTEFLGGVGLVLGVLTRFWSLGLAITMAVAMFKVHWANGFFLGGEKSGIEYTFVLLLLAAALAISGPGRIAFGDPEGKLLGAAAR
ncbi:MAG: DoxX family protein [Fimbriimonadales bacterium]